MENKNLKILDAGILKIVTYLSMVCDHANKAIILPYLEIYNAYSATCNTITSLLNIIGTFAFFIFCFLLVESCFKTRNKFRFLGLLLLSALASEVPFDLGTYKVLNEPGHQNIFFTLSLIVILVFFNENIRKKINRIPWIIVLILSTFIGIVISEFLSFDFGFYGVVLGMIFYLGHLAYEKFKSLSSKVFPHIFGYLLMFKEWYIFPTFILLMIYNGKRGRQSKLVNYTFYPLHFIFLWGIYKFFIEV